MRKKENMRKFQVLLGAGLLFLLAHAGLAQREPDPNVGNVLNRREGIMDGNLVRTIFVNWGEIANWPNQPSGEWPKGTGHSYVDGVALVVQARTVDRDGNIIYPLETQYREFVDKDPVTDELWGWGPLPGYFNPKGDQPAMSDDPDTWPDIWPDKPVDWAGFWNGFFGKGVFNADLESYFVFDDDPDEEWNFYPDPSDTTRRGLGLEVAARLFQWSHVLAEDVIFAIYFITNEGKTDYDSTYYNFYIDWGVGGVSDSDDDTGDYDLELDIAYAWDWDGKGKGGWSPVGVTGFAFLESPGISTDLIDNDSDGLIDETREGDGPGRYLDQFPYGIADVEAFRKFYGREPKPHWSADENANWDPFLDVNENGEWDPGEPLNDDVGKDGLRPFQEGYDGPDEGEGDGMPTPGEPDYDFLDKDESDQIGLTGFRIFSVHTYELWNEKQNWGVFKSAPPPHEGLQITANLGMFFSSGPFPLAAGQTENYSMALIFAEDVQDLAKTKKTVQQIYNTTYRFAQPPDAPIVKAYPGDGRVVLTWDDQAEKSFDAFLQEFDFEGYKIYRSTEPQFLETRQITDAFGRDAWKKPIAQFDLVNGIKGLHPLDFQSGVSVPYNLGTDSGLRHVYIDTDVQNGQTYYYAVVAYDHGFVDTTIVDGKVSVEVLEPSESSFRIDKDLSGNLTLSPSTAVVTPNPPAAGWVQPQIDGEIVHETPGTGTVGLEFLIPEEIRDGHSYEVSFYDTSQFHLGSTAFLTMYDVTGGDRRLVVDTMLVRGYAETPLADGFVVIVQNDQSVEIDRAATGWLVGSSNYKVTVDFDPRFSSETNPLLNINIPYPADFEIRFSDDLIGESAAALGVPKVKTRFQVWNLTEDAPAKFLFNDVVPDGTLTPDTTESIIIFVDNPKNLLKLSTTWRILFETDPLQATPRAPQAGDVYRITTRKPFRTGDTFRFTVKGRAFDPGKAKTDLANVYVVPNPYRVAATWEPKSPFRFGRGERRIYFNNLPKDCTIRIYTIRGYLVDTIEHHGDAANGSEPWDLVSKDGQDIAYGVYVYHVEAPGIGEHISKFAVIK